MAVKSRLAVVMSSELFIGDTEFELSLSYLQLKCYLKPFLSDFLLIVLTDRTDTKSVCRLCS